MHGADRPHQIGHADALDDIAACARLQCCGHMLLTLGAGQDHRLNAGMLLRNLARGFDAVPRHVDVEQDQVGSVFACNSNGIFGAGAVGHNFEPTGALETVSCAFTENGMIVDNRYSDYKI